MLVSGEMTCDRNQIVPAIPNKEVRLHVPTDSS